MASPGRTGEPASADPERPARPGGGLRERKKRRTRLAIQREALRLFQEQGYAETTVEQIAEAVEISPSTFFNYFPSKEDVIVSDDYDPMIVGLLTSRPPEEPLGVALRSVLGQGMAAVVERERDVMLARGRLALAEPELRGRLFEETQRNEEFIRRLIADRTGGDPDAYELRVAAGVLAGAFYTAVMEWARQDGAVPMYDLVDRALRIVESGALLDVTGEGRRAPS